MGCHNAKSCKTRPDFYYQTSYLNKQYSDLSQKLKQVRERIYEAIEKAYLLQNKEISQIQDNETIRETINQLQQSKETQEFYAIEIEFTHYEKTQKVIQLELYDIVEQHKLLLKKINYKQPPNVEKMLSKMQNHRQMFLAYYHMIYNPQILYDEKTNYQYQPSSKAYSTRDDM